MNRAPHNEKDGVKNDFFSIQRLAKNLIYLMLFSRPPIGVQAVCLYSTWPLRGVFPSCWRWARELCAHLHLIGAGTPHAMPLGEREREQLLS